MNKIAMLFELLSLPREIVEEEIHIKNRIHASARKTKCTCISSVEEEQDNKERNTSSKKNKEDA